MQTSYADNMAIGFPGMVYDSYHGKDIISRCNPAVVIPFGVAVCRGTNLDRDVKLPTTAAEAAACVGIALANMSMESNPGVAAASHPVNAAVPVIKRGRVWVQVLEAVSAGDDVYVRYANGTVDVSDIQKGAFGKKGGDGAFQVATLTPSVANTTQYFVEINGQLFTFVSDGSATDAEIVAGLTTLINASGQPVAATGSTTLILTSTVRGQAFTISASTNFTVAATVPNSASTARLPGAKFYTSAAENGLAVVELNLPV